MNDAEEGNGHEMIIPETPDFLLKGRKIVKGNLSSKKKLSSKYTLRNRISFKPHLNSFKTEKSGHSDLSTISVAKRKTTNGASPDLKKLKQKPFKQMSLNSYVIQHEKYKNNLQLISEKEKKSCVSKNLNSYFSSKLCEKSDILSKEKKIDKDIAFFSSEVSSDSVKMPNDETLNTVAIQNSPVVVIHPLLPSNITSSSSKIIGKTNSEYSEINLSTLSISHETGKEKTDDTAHGTENGNLKSTVKNAVYDFLSGNENNVKKTYNLENSENEEILKPEQIYEFSGNQQNLKPPCGMDSSLSWLSDVDWDDTEDLKISDMAIQKLSPLKGIRHSASILSDSSKEYDHSNVRYKVVKIMHDAAKNEILLHLKSVVNNQLKTCTLKGFWAESLLNKEDTVHVLTPFINNHAVIDDNSGFFVISPDFLVSSTAVVSTLFCMRKAVLIEMFRSWDNGNFIMMIGSLVHQLFQEITEMMKQQSFYRVLQIICIEQKFEKLVVFKRYSTDSNNLRSFLRESVYNEISRKDIILIQTVQNGISSVRQVEDILQAIMKRTDNLIAMCSLGVTENEVMTEISNFIPSIIQWIHDYCLTENDKPSKDIQVTEIRDIEDNVWCPKFGIKGKIDVTVEVTIHSKKMQHKLMPLELKTGRPTFSAEHQGQVNLYSMMMEDRSTNAIGGLLLYLKNGPQMKQISVDHNIRRGLIQLRNDLTHFLEKSTSKNVSMNGNRDFLSGNCNLPEPINNKRACQKCPYLLPCTVYQRAFEDYTPTDSSHPMTSLVSATTGHLSENHLQYFQHWLYLLSLEMSYDTKGFWNEDAWSREKQGLCFSSVVLCRHTLTQQEREGDVYVHTFIQAACHPTKCGFSTLGPRAGDAIIISNQENNLEIALATGFIVKVASTYVEVSIDRDLQKISRYEGFIFRLDKYHSSSYIFSNYSNLMKLMSADSSPTHLRQLIIDKESPDFLPTLSKKIVTLGHSILKPLNKPQQRAVFKALMAKDYLLLKGMPGTGKTSTIVALVRLMVKMGSSVLLTSYTHSAVDNILLKLLKYEIDFVRIGKLARIHPDIRPLTFEMQTKKMTSVQEFSEIFNSKIVVATTCLGVNHVIFNRRQFDICIVDEASQILQTSCLGPLFCAKKFILVGDPKQLPPVVKNERAKHGGMDESLFSRLESSSNCMELVLQYRMNKEIMRLCNELTYNGILQTGSEEVANSVLHLQYSSTMLNPLLQDSWLTYALKSDIKNSVVFLNTDQIPAFESRDAQGLVKNNVEIQLVLQLMKLMVKAGLSKQDVGIITPYRFQVQLIQDIFGKHELQGIEVNTVDQYQGRDKQVILISCVRSSTDPINDPSAGKIIDDERRLNVAISRAKKKLIIIGSKLTLSAYKPFKKLLKILRSDQLLNLPPKAHILFQDEF